MEGGLDLIAIADGTDQSGLLGPVGCEPEAHVQRHRLQLGRIIEREPLTGHRPVNRIVEDPTAGCVEVVEDQLNGYLVPVRNADALARAILQLSEDPEIRQRFGRESRERAVARFDLSTVAEQICSIYRKLLVQKCVSSNGVGKTSKH